MILLHPFYTLLFDFCLFYVRIYTSAKGTIRNSHIISKVRHMLYRMGFELNDNKTVFITSSQQQRVTGVVVNEKPQITKTMRRAIRQAVYYCTKFGVEENIQYKGLDIAPEQYLRSLLGRISFALQIDPQNETMQRYFDTVKNLLNMSCLT